MIAPGSPILYSDLATLATLATTKLAPAKPYTFPPVAGQGQIGLASQPIPTPTTTNSPFNFSGPKVTLWLFSYKTIAGVKTYSLDKSSAAYLNAQSAPFYTVSWAWNPPSLNPPDGYLAVMPIQSSPFSQLVSARCTYQWLDIGNVTTLVTDGTFTGWNRDVSLIPNVQLGNPAFTDIPCAHAIWMKVLNAIWHDLFNAMDLFGGSKITFNPSKHCVSGPWVVSTGPKCYLQLNGKAVFNNLQFIYSQADSMTGNSISLEYDFTTNQLANFVTGANALTFSTNGTVNGTITLYSNAPNQTWTLSGSDPSITTSSNPSVIYPGGFQLVTALIFTFTNTPYTGALTITATPPAGGSLIGASNNGSLNFVYSAAPVVKPQTAYSPVIHYSGSSAQSVALANTGATLTFTDPSSATFTQVAHWRAYCNGVFIANTIPTMGLMPFVDVDLPNYSPNSSSGFASSRRIALDISGQPCMDNREVLWPVFQDGTDFNPDSVAGQPFLGSKAFQQSILTKQVGTNLFTNFVPSNSSGLFNLVQQIFVPQGSADVRFLCTAPGCTIYVNPGSAPTLGTFAASSPSGTWLSLAASAPGFQTNTFWLIGIYNPTSGPVTDNEYVVTVINATPPNGTFFSTDSNGNANLEGQSYTFDTLLSSGFTQRTTPINGYSIFSVTIDRLPGTPNTAPVSVNLGLRAGFGWSAPGTFQNIQTFTIPAGQNSVTQQVFWPVLSGTPLDVQCSQVVIVRALANFQPMMHSTFDIKSQSQNGQFQTGIYDNPLYFNQNYALFFPDAASDDSQGVVLPIAAILPNDLTAVLNTL